jgi:RimJ/RimL family protein N-acetyltransferase
VDGPPIPRLETERLVLREWRAADRAPFATMNADPRVMEHLSGPLDPAASDAFIDRIVARWADGHGLWAVERREDGRFLGFVGLAAPDFEAAFTPCVEIGWRLAVEAWGHGYATEAARAALRFGFERLDLEEIVSFTLPGNIRSRAVMERLGMTTDPAEDFRLPARDGVGPHRDVVLYRLQRADWAATSAGPAERA